MKEFIMTADRAQLEELTRIVGVTDDHTLIYSTPEKVFNFIYKREAVEEEKISEKDITNFKAFKEALEADLGKFRKNLGEYSKSESLEKIIKILESMDVDGAIETLENIVGQMSEDAGEVILSASLLIELLDYKKDSIRERVPKIDQILEDFKLKTQWAWFPGLGDKFSEFAVEDDYKDKPLELEISNDYKWATKDIETTFKDRIIKKKEDDKTINILMLSKGENLLLRRAVTVGGTESDKERFKARLKASNLEGLSGSLAQLDHFIEAILSEEDKIDELPDVIFAKSYGEPVFGDTLRRRKEQLRRLRNYYHEKGELPDEDSGLLETIFSNEIDLTDATKKEKFWGLFKEIFNLVKEKSPTNKLSDLSFKDFDEQVLKKLLYEADFKDGNDLKTILEKTWSMRSFLGVSTTFKYLDRFFPKADYKYMLSVPTENLVKLMRRKVKLMRGKKEELVEELVIPTFLLRDDKKIKSDYYNFGFISPSAEWEGEVTFLGSFDEYLPGKKLEKKVAAQKTPEVEILDIKDFVKTGPQLGSQPGGFYQNKKTGETWYFKFPLREELSRNEILAEKLYKAAGLEEGTQIPELKFVRKDDKIGVAYRVIPNVKSDRDILTSGQVKGKLREDIFENFMVDAWLANWGVVGLTYDNLLIKDGKRAVRIDLGGSLRFRAQGAPKGKLFGNKVGEIETLRNKNINLQSAKVFGQITDEELIKGAEKVLSVSDEKIKELVNKYGPKDDKTKDELIKTLIERKKYIKEYIDKLKKKKKLKVFEKFELKLPESVQKLVDDIKAGSYSDIKSLNDEISKVLLPKIDSLSAEEVALFIRVIESFAEEMGFSIGDLEVNVLIDLAGKLEFNSVGVMDIKSEKIGKYLRTLKDHEKNSKYKLIDHFFEGYSFAPGGPWSSLKLKPGLEEKLNGIVKKYSELTPRPSQKAISESPAVNTIKKEQEFVEIAGKKYKKGYLILVKGKRLEILGFERKESGTELEVKSVEGNEKVKVLLSSADTTLEQAIDKKISDLRKEIKDLRRKTDRTVDEQLEKIVELIMLRKMVGEIETIDPDSDVYPLIVGLTEKEKVDLKELKDEEDVWEREGKFNYAVASFYIDLKGENLDKFIEELRNKANEENAGSLSFKYFKPREGQKPRKEHRADFFVLYVRDRFQMGDLRKILLDIHKNHPEWFREETPLLTKPIAKGISFASRRGLYKADSKFGKDVRDMRGLSLDAEMSYNGFMTDLIVKALNEAAKENKPKLVEDVVEKVKGFLEELSIDEDQPWELAKPKQKKEEHPSIQFILKSSLND